MLKANKIKEFSRWLNSFAVCDMDLQQRLREIDEAALIDGYDVDYEVPSIYTKSGHLETFLFIPTDIQCRTE